MYEQNQKLKESETIDKLRKEEIHNNAKLRVANTYETFQ